MHIAISIMKEVAAWGREQGYRVWPDEWLTPEELVTPDAQPENFCIGSVYGEIACAFILQWTDSDYWPHAPEYEAAYLLRLWTLSTIPMAEQWRCTNWKCKKVLKS